VRESGDLEGRCQVDGLVQQLLVALESGAAGGEIGQLGVFQVDGREARDGQRVGGVVM
jgi:hypothetical protein